MAMKMLVILCLAAGVSAFVRPTLPRVLAPRRDAVSMMLWSDAAIAAAGVTLTHSSAPSASATVTSDLDAITSDLKDLITKTDCGPIMVRLSWHDAGVFSDGELKGGCPNAAMRFTDGGEGAFGANAGLPDVALGLLAPLTKKWVEDAGSISHADLWTLAANVGIELMGGPAIPTRFGRADAASSADSVESQVGRLPDGDKGIDHLREIFHPKGFSDKDIVALSGAHTVGECKADRSGFDGAWTAEKFAFDNSYFVDMMNEEYTRETVAATGNEQQRSAKGTIMLDSDLAMLTDPAFKTHVEAYAKSEATFFKDFTAAWVKLQENGCSADLRNCL